MKVLRSLRLIFLALLVSFIPLSSYAGVFISVNFAPPMLPIYEQPPCPDEGLMWIPGYWAYGEDGYFWIPGTWVPAPYEGALWTPPYWGWDSGLYMFHPGYWGRHVGYYGGVNYGFGYMGIGFVGGMWRGHDFEYNRAVMRVDERRIHNVYEDRQIVDRYTIRNDRRVAFSGGRDGIHHDPRPEERIADRDQHLRETSFQQSHDSAARSDRSMYVKNNGGRPSNAAVQRPFGGGGQGGQDRNAAPGGQNQGGGGNAGRSTYTPSNGNNGNNGGNRPGENPRGNYSQPGGGFNGTPRGNNAQPDNRQFNNQRGNQGSPQPQPQPRTAPDFRQAPPQQNRPAPEVRQMPQQRPQPEFRQQPQQQPRPQPQVQQRPEPQQRPQPQQQPHSNPQPQQHGGDQHGDHEGHQH